MLDQAKVAEAVKAARTPRLLSEAGLSGHAYIVSDIPGANRLPRALVCLLENVIRRASSDEDAIRMATAILEAGLAGRSGSEVEFMPARVLFQDFTGVPVFVDFAAMRDAMVERGGDPSVVNPRIPCTLVIDHSVIADVASDASAVEKNQQLEAKRNRERFAFLKWASQSFSNVEIVPPGGGICHQLNIERFCSVVTTDALCDNESSTPTLCFDTLVGTDSHTTTANGLGVLGWGVGGIEAEAAALGTPISLLVPPVIELRLEGTLPQGTSGMDLALTVAELLRAHGVVGSIIEVTGPGAAQLSATQRACVANMTPEYGATATLFPVDDVCCDFLRLTGRDTQAVSLARRYVEEQGVFGDAPNRVYSNTLILNLNDVTPSLAGPSRPHDRVELSGVQGRFRQAFSAAGKNLQDKIEVEGYGELSHGTLAIAAITSCTTATDPAMMVAAGLVARRAREHGLEAKPWVKRILAPGSRSSQILLERAGLLPYLEDLGFSICGFGCMSCIGNSGEIDPALHAVANRLDLASVLSGNRNFEGRISPDVVQNYLAQPALVVAYAIAGTIDIDLTTQPLGYDKSSAPIMLSDLMPSDDEVAAVLEQRCTSELFAEGASNLFEGSSAWSAISTTPSDTFAWDLSSTYVRRAPYFELACSQEVLTITNARVLALLGDFITTDHISPAGSIALESPAGMYLSEHGVSQSDYNTLGSRRGNHEVMARGTFANIRLRNMLADGRQGGWTTNFLTDEISTIFDASQAYAQANVPLVVIAGRLYGSGSSRDWAGKGPLLLGVRAVIAESFERIHRSNLVQMGVLPLQFEEGQNAQTLGLTGHEIISIDPVTLRDAASMQESVAVHAVDELGNETVFGCKIRIDTPMEAAFMASGGILPHVLQGLC